MDLVGDSSIIRCVKNIYRDWPGLPRQTSNNKINRFPREKDIVILLYYTNREWSELSVPVGRPADKTDDDNSDYSVIMIRDFYKK